MVETDIKTIRIELPFVKIGPSEDIHDFDTYNSAGLFFIELPDGSFQVADVVGKGGGVCFWDLPPSFSSFVSKLLAKKEQQKKESEVLDALDRLHQSLDGKFADVYEKVSSLIEMKKESNFTLSTMIHESNASIGEVRGQNSQIRTMLEKLGESKKNTPEGGFVTEKTLLDIISSVRK
jgi:hypothetical protein